MRIWHRRLLWHSHCALGPSFASASLAHLLLFFFKMRSSSWSAARREASAASSMHANSEPQKRQATATSAHTAVVPAWSAPSATACTAAAVHTQELLSVKG